ncbi:hypothetical protein NUM3379_07480 [Kineococcus sp. NUM-3379]
MSRTSTPRTAAPRTAVRRTAASRTAVRRTGGALVAAATALAVALPTTAAAAAPPQRDVRIDASAPVITRDDIVIDAPLHTVWEVQTDVEGWPSWQPGVTALEKLTGGPLRAGSRFHWLVEGLDVTSTVRQVRPNRRIVWGGPGNSIDAVHVWTFTPRPDGVHVHTEESWSGAPVEADVAWAQHVLDESLDAWLHNLEAEAERRSGAAR